jgi:GH24 family phage-related lysozyme (muramidase)
MVNQQTAATQADQQTIENQSDYSNTVASTQADQQAVENQTQQTEIMTIEDHPIHGSFDIEIPASYTDEQASRYVDGLDLDLLLGMPQKKGKDNKDLGVTNVEQLKEWENSVGSGKRGDKWFTHDSLEGGTPTIAYGSKLTQEEYDTGKMKIGDKLVNWRSGITEEQAQARLNQDAGSAKQVALAALTKANMADDPNKVSALTSLIYNVGSGAWAKSKAKKYLETGRIEDFMYEAFSPEVGFVKVNGEVSRGLVRRRAAEAQLFGEGNIGQGGGFGSMMSEVLSKLNPISSAQASERTPQDQQMAQAVQDAPVKPDVPVQPTQAGTLGDVTVPKKPTLETKPDGSIGVKEDPSFLSELTKTAKTFWKDIKDTVDVIPSSAQVYANHALGYTGILTESILNKDEKNFLTGIVKEGLRLKKNGISYTPSKGNIAYGPEGSKGIGYSKEIDLFQSTKDNIKFTLGKADIIRNGNSIMIADEYDMPMDQGVLKALRTTEKELRNASLATKLEYVAGAKGGQGKAHRFAELFAAPEGKALSQRYTVGTLKELGLTEEEVSHLQTLEQYEKNKLAKGKMNPNNRMTGP